MQSDNSRPDATWMPRRPSIGVDPHLVDPSSVLSAEEIDLLHQKFARFNPNANKARSLPAADAVRLFRDDFPLLSEWETQTLFQKCDLNCDGKLALHEYVQTRAYHRLVVEADNEIDIARSFMILDTDNDGVLIASEVLSLVEQAKQPGARLLKDAILQAAEATREASFNQSERLRHVNPIVAATGSHTSKGEITLDHFKATIRDINRAIERDIAAKTLRIIALSDKLESLQTAAQEPGLSSSNKTNILSKIQSNKVELDVLRTEVSRCRKEQLTHTGQSSALGKICETLVASYENEQHVYECLTNFIKHCGLEDPVVFRYNLEQSGREVHVLDSVLMMPPAHVTKSREYTEMLELASCRHEDVIHPQRDERSMPSCPSTSRSDARSYDKRYSQLHANAPLRKHFVFYTMLSDVTNLESMTRSSFIKFVKDCKLHLIQNPNMTDPDIGNIFSKAISNHAELSHGLQRGIWSVPSRKASMNFTCWLIGCDLIFQRNSSTGQLDPEELESKMKIHVISKAHAIQTQNIAPDVSQTHVLKLLRQHIWPLRQIFLHFTSQSLLELHNNGALTMRQFLQFARAFKILRASDERDGDPYQPSTFPVSNSIRPVSLVELVREFYAAKLDVSFSNSGRRDQLDMTFREFLRCVQRIALTMYPKPRNQKPSESNFGTLTTSFEVVKEDDERKPKLVETPHHHRRRNILASSSSPAKISKMTSTSVISKLLDTSRAIAAGRKASDTADITKIARTSLRSRSPTRIIYGNSVTSSAIPNIPLTTRDPNTVRNCLSQQTHISLDGKTEPWITPYRPVSVPLITRESNSSPRSPRHKRPISCGGPPIVRVISNPGQDNSFI